MKNTLLLGAIVLFSACTGQQHNEIERHKIIVDNIPYCDANTTRPSVELTQIDRTELSTQLTFMALYDYYDTTFPLGDEIYLVAGDTMLPVESVCSIGNTVIRNNNVVMPQGVPVQFKLIFPGLPTDVKSFDLIQKRNGTIANSIWGIDLTGERMPNEFPSEIPADLLEHNHTSDSLPAIVRKDGVAKIIAHAVAWRDWMDHSVKFVVNTIDDTQEIIESEFDDNGIVTVEIPLKGTANVSAFTPYNTYASFYVDPDEDINLYILPDHTSDAQRFIRPAGVIDGKYRHIEAMRDKLIFFNKDAEVDLLGKTRTKSYYKAMMKIHSDGLDSIKARNFPPDLEKYARASIDLSLMAQTLIPDAYTPRDWDKRDAAKADTVLRFSPEQIKQIRSSIDFDNPLLELISIGNPGTRSLFLKTKELLFAE